jgi:DNA-binding HxlR family transcriptional regulator
MSTLKTYRCPVQLTLDLVSGKWKTHILWELRGGPRGFNELLAALRGVSHKVLAKQLRELERGALITRRVRSGRRTDYAMTPFGSTLRPSLDALARWAKTHHAAVGARLDWPS